MTDYICYVPSNSIKLKGFLSHLAGYSCKNTIDISIVQGASIDKIISNDIIPIFSNFDSKSRELEKTYAKIDEIGKLGKNWNGYGAKSFTKKLIKECKEIVSQLPVIPDVYPTGRRSIQIQYELEDKSYLGFEIFEDKISYLQVPKRIYKDAITGELSISDVEKMKKIVEEFYERQSNRRRDTVSSDKTLVPKRIRQIRKANTGSFYG